jgi:hypothetical protein
MIFSIDFKFEGVDLFILSSIVVYNKKISTWIFVLQEINIFNGNKKEHTNWNMECKNKVKTYDFLFEILFSFNISIR